MCESMPLQVAHHDPELHLALSSKGSMLGTSGAAWLIMRTFFSEVCSLNHPTFPEYSPNVP
jgi:hypothetical protein